MEFSWGFCVRVTLLILLVVAIVTACFTLPIEQVVELSALVLIISYVNLKQTLNKHFVTASYVDESLLKLAEKAQLAGITVFGEMGLVPGIDHMMAMKMINEAQTKGGKVRSFTSCCGGLPSPTATNNPLAYKFRF